MSVVLFGALTGCNPKQEVKPFSVSFKGAGPGSATVMATVPSPTTVSYLITDEEDPTLDEMMLNILGEKVTFYTDGEQQLLDFPVEENTKYYLYLVGILGEDFSKMYTFEFETGDFEFNQLATVVGVMPDGYKVQLKMPESVLTSEYGKPGSTAIRYTQGDLMIYNYYRTSKDDYFNLLYNGGRSVRRDTVITYNDKLNYGEAGIDVNEDGVVDENDMSILWNPIAPGEPVVFVVGEFEWMEEPEEYKKGGALEDSTYVVNGFAYPGGWDPGYYAPCLDTAKYFALYPDLQRKGLTKSAGIINDIDLTHDLDDAWTGAFQRKIFRTRVPAKLNGKFQLEVTNLKSVNANLRIIPSENIYRYLFTVLDDGAYNQMLGLLDGHEEYVQWAVTSYFAMYNFGQIQVVAETGETSAPICKFALTDYFYNVPAETKYHVLVTGMSGEIGSPQCFEHFTFSTPAKTKTRGPNVVVTALEDESTPYVASFNIKCTSYETNPVDRCYYAANYKSDWVYQVNGSNSNTYESLGHENQILDDNIISQINSETGYRINIPTIDGETTRLVVVAYNDENISNGIDLYEDAIEHPAVEDCTTPYAKAADNSYNELLDEDILVGDWTLTATLDGGKVVKERINIRRRFVEGVDYPKTLPEDVLKVYQDATEWTDDEIYGFFDEFIDVSKSFNRDRLRNQNKLLIENWVNDEMGSLTYYSPWDLFKHKKISMVDVPSMFARFGPKIYLHVNKSKSGADSLSVTANNMFVSPVAQWSTTPFYMAGCSASYEEGEEGKVSTIFQWSNAEGAWVGALEFPVTLSEDRQTITIKPIEANGTLWYPNVVGIASSYGGTTNYVLEKAILSEVVLTKGWDEPVEEEQPAPATRSLARTSRQISVIGDPNFIEYSPRGTFNGKSQQKREIVVDGKSKITTSEKLQENLERYHNALLKQLTK